MIIDSLANLGNYKQLHPRFEQAISYLESIDLMTLSAGRHEIDGQNIFLILSVKEGSKAGEAKFEAHESYIDIQICLHGTETIGWKPRQNCKNAVAAYNPDKDVIFYQDRPDTYFQLHEKQFAIFFSEDVHAPMIGDGKITKIVVKVKVN